MFTDESPLSGHDLLKAAMIRRVLLDLQNDDPIIALDALQYLLDTNEYAEFVSESLNFEYLFKECIKYGKN